MPLDFNPSSFRLLDHWWITNAAATAACCMWLRVKSRTSSPHIAALSGYIGGNANRVVLMPGKAWNGPTVMGGHFFNKRGRQAYTPNRHTYRHIFGPVLLARTDKVTIQDDMERSRFEALVAQALDGVPRTFRETLTNVAIIVEDRPPQEPEGGLLLGLFHGIPRTEKSVFFLQPA